MNKNTVALLVLFVLALILSSCASTRKGTSRFDESNSPYVKEQPKTTVKPKETLNNDSKTVMVREEKVKSVDYSGTETIYRYYVILGSFEVLDNAKNFRTQLISEQFKPIILESEIGFFRVSVAAFNDELAARNQIHEIRNNYSKYTDAWLLIRK